MKNGIVRRLSAFANGPSGGNPAGVWMGSELPQPSVMQRIAADVGYSETAFIAPMTGDERKIRFFSPEAEVSFCGHATIASGIALGRVNGPGTYRLLTSVGMVPVKVRMKGEDLEATLQSVETHQEGVSDTLLESVLQHLGWANHELDPSIPPIRAYAGAWHLVLAVKESERLARCEYDFNRLKATMLDAHLTTLQLIWRECEGVFHSRNPFPVGGVVEDPATGAAAAALGGYLRDAGMVKTPFSFVIRQGEAMGRPSLLHVTIPAKGGILVTGTAIDIPSQNDQPIGHNEI